MEGDDGRTMRAGSFELCDGECRVRALLGLGTGGLVALDLADEAGRVRASLAVGGDGSVSLKLSDADGRYRAGLGAWGDGSAGLDLWGPRDAPPREPRGRRRGAERGDALRHRGEAARPARARARARPRRLGRVLGRRRRLRAGSGTWPNGATGVELLDDRVHPRARFGTRAPGDDHGARRAPSEDPAAGTVTLDFWDRDGTYRVGLGGDGIDFYRAGDGHPLTHGP